MLYNTARIASPTVFARTIFIFLQQVLVYILHRHDAGVETKAVCLIDTLSRIGHRTQLAGQADLAETHDAFRQRLVPKAGCDCQHHRQIHSRLVQPHAADDVDIHIARREKQPAAFFQNGDSSTMRL